MMQKIGKGQIHHISHRMLKSASDKSRDRENDSKDFICSSSSAIRESDSKAHQDIAKHTKRKRLQKAIFKLMDTDID